MCIGPAPRLASLKNIYLHMCSYSEHKKGGLGRGWMCVVIRGMCIGS